jgi:hypothetical protein
MEEQRSFFFVSSSSSTLHNTHPSSSSSNKLAEGSTGASWCLEKGVSKKVGYQELLASGADLRSHLFVSSSS